jgi:CDP-6-deoxy-D-xylo-4-hexulose-3-dehydrase
MDNFWPLMKDIITQEDKQKMADFCLNSNRFTNGKKVKEFENEWSKWIGSKYSLMVSSGSTANYLLLSAIKDLYNLKNGDKVLVPTMTWVTNISPVFQLGFTPIFCDVNSSNFSFDEAYLKKIKTDHPDIKLIWVTHLFGLASNIKKVKELWPKALIAEDVCESHGVESDNKKLGLEGEGGTFSFYYGHHMTTVEGGIISTNSKNLYELMRAKRSHGMARETSPETFKKYQSQFPDIDPQFMFVTDGYNFRSMEINAVLGLSQLSNLTKWVNIRKDNFNKFLNIIKDIDYLDSNFTKEGNSSFCLPFVCDSPKNSQKLKSYLQNQGIETRPLCSGNLLRQPFLKEKNYPLPSNFPNSEKLHECGFYIGNNHMILDEDFDKLKVLLNNFNNE